jgi:hypothetical protein
VTTFPFLPTKLATVCQKLYVTCFLSSALIRVWIPAVSPRLNKTTQRCLYLSACYVIPRVTCKKVCDVRLRKRNSSRFYLNYFFFGARWQITAEKMRRLFSPYLSARSDDSLRHFRVISYSGFYIMYRVYFFNKSQITHQRNVLYFFFTFYYSTPTYVSTLTGSFSGGS